MPPEKYRFVMLVDDNDLDNFLNEKVIALHRFSEQTYVNSSGISALEFLRNLQVMSRHSEVNFPEVIFIDINMPIMDGFQFIRKLREAEQDILEKSKLVVLTSSVYEDDRRKVQELDERIVFLNKPLTPELLDTL